MESVQHKNVIPFQKIAQENSQKLSLFVANFSIRVHRNVDRKLAKNLIFSRMLSKI